MLTNTRLSLSEVLDKYRAALSKTAEDGVVDAPETEVEDKAREVADAVPPVEAAEAQPETEVVDMDTVPANGSVKADDLQNAAADVKNAQSAAVDAASTLKTMADEYIAQHDESIKKEASVFGEMFANSAFETLQKRAAVYGSAQDAYEQTLGALQESDTEIGDVMDKTAEEVSSETYIATLLKMASQEAYNQTVNALGAGAADVDAPDGGASEACPDGSCGEGEEEEKDQDEAQEKHHWAMEESAAKAVSDSAQAAKVLMNHMVEDESETEEKEEGEEGEHAEPDGDEDGSAPSDNDGDEPDSQAAAQALLAQQAAQGDPQAAAANAAYAQAMNQVAAAQPTLPQYTQNAYEAAQQAIQQPQG